MRTSRPALSAALAAALSTVLAGCGNHDGGERSAGIDNPVMQTHFPGEYTAGGGTSGEVIGRSSAVNEAKNSAGTPGIPAGKGGTVGGTATGGAVQGSEQGSSSGADTGADTGAAGGKEEAGSSAAPSPAEQSKPK